MEGSTRFLHVYDVLTFEIALLPEFSKGAGHMWTPGQLSITIIGSLNLSHVELNFMEKKPPTACGCFGAFTSYKYRSQSRLLACWKADASHFCCWIRVRAWLWVE